MKNKGFTLIELLAVILILGIIALIAIPTVNGVIDQSRKGAAESSARTLVKAIEEKAVVNELNDLSIKDGRYTVEEINNMQIEIKGTKPDMGTIVIENNDVVACDLWYGNNNVICNYNEKDVTVYTFDKNSWEKAENDTYIAKAYYDPTTGEKCDNDALIANLANYSNTKLDSNNNKSQTGLKNGCMIWYAYKDNGDGTVNMILNHNTTIGIKAANSDNATTFDLLYNALSLDTNGWKNEASLIDIDDIARAFKADKTLGFNSQNPYFLKDDGTETTSFEYSDVDDSYKTNENKYFWLLENLRFDQASKYKAKVYDSSEFIMGFWSKNVAVNNSNSFLKGKTLVWTVGQRQQLKIINNINYVSQAAPYIVGAIVPTEGTVGIRPVVTVERKVFE